MPRRFIPYGRQWIDDQDIQSVVDVLKGDYLTTGPAIDKFEQALAEYTGSSYATVLSSGTAALHAAYYAASLGPGDEIITSPLTFVATANAALYLGANVRFVDIQEDTGNIDPKLIEAAINEKTKLIVPVDYAGHPADYDEINSLAERYNLAVVSDAAHSLGARYRGRRVGALAHLTTFSFHPLKTITSAEGGAVVTNNKNGSEKIKWFRHHGINKCEVCVHDEPWRYEICDIGYNYRISDVHCAIGLSQLAKIEIFIERQRYIAEQYNKKFSEFEGLTLPEVRSYVDPAWHLYVIRVNEGLKQRKRLFNRLRKGGLGVQVHYLPVYCHPYYSALGYARGLCRNAEEFYEQAISIPIYAGMSDEQIQYVMEEVSCAVREVIQ